jgi:hypothetical protein
MFLATVALGLGACSGDDGSPPPIDSPAIDADPNMPDAPAVCGTGGSVGYLEACPNGDECGDTCICNVFHPDNPRCTKTCATNADCPAPSPGCLLPDGICRL